ncbi:uncharacterized protein VTP21DRAFT_5391 [Calcarisporiella thermophila]|uniref:uncharacterized protein n=1 Tax=Calcarisporiella thermophila TaxID=911321 RepID=UPI00374462C1
MTLSSQASQNADIFPHFASKLFDLLESQSHPHLISWSPQGTHFIIHNIPDFSTHVLPLVFKHSKFSSFVRQLNIYGFRRVTDGRRMRHCSSRREVVFWHPEFRRGEREGLSKVKRRPQPRGRKSSSSVSLAPPASSPATVASYQPRVEDGGGGTGGAGEGAGAGAEGRKSAGDAKDLLALVLELRHDLARFHTQLSKLTPQIQRLAHTVEEDTRNLGKLKKVVLGKSEFQHVYLMKY